LTFDAALDRAANLARATTVEAAPRTWLQRLGWAVRDRWAPTETERDKAMAAIKWSCRYMMETKGKLPSEAHLRERVRLEVGFGPLTWLWIIATVTQFLAALRDLLNERGETS
jgi:hypothetical protein